MAEIFEKIWLKIGQTFTTDTMTQCMDKNDVVDVPGAF